MLCRNIFNYLIQSRRLLSSSIKPEVDRNYLCNPKNIKEIGENISLRKGVGNIELVCQIQEKLNAITQNSPDYESLNLELEKELLKIPNRTHPEVKTYNGTPKIIKEVNLSKKSEKQFVEFQEIAKKLKLIRTEHLGNVSGSKSYYILGELAELEQALINYVLSKLLKHKFNLVSVPDILSRETIEACGMNTQGQRTQVYSLDPSLHPPDLCLSGTSEMSLAYLLSNKKIPRESLPQRLAAVSRCYRAETSNLQEERGIYRVHEFTKVEMFIVSTPETSEQLLGELLKIQEEIFTSLGLSFQILDMPPSELGAPAYRKYDIEAWLPGRRIFGEISSCSNCLDYQARRLAIQCQEGEFAHTLNGTACAVPRLLMAIVETFQDGHSVGIPPCLEEFLNFKMIQKQKKIPELKLVKSNKKCK